MPTFAIPSSGVALRSPFSEITLASHALTPFHTIGFQRNGSLLIVEAVLEEGTL